MIVHSLRERSRVALTMNCSLRTVYHVNRQIHISGGVERLDERHDLIEINRRTARLKNRLFVHSSLR